MESSSEPYSTVTGSVQEVTYTEDYDIEFVNMTPQTMPYLPPEVTVTTVLESENTGTRSSPKSGIFAQSISV